MNSQDDDFNSRLNNVSTPDKPEIPIRTGTNALKDKFVISKASNLPLTTDKEESENPVLSSDQNESNTQAGILDSVISKASDLPLTDEQRADIEEYLKLENPVLSSDQNESNTHAGILDLNTLSSISLPKSCQWNYDSDSPCIIFKSQSFYKHLILLIVTVIGSILYIIFLSSKIGVTWDMIWDVITGIIAVFSFPVMGFLIPIFLFNCLRNIIHTHPNYIITIVIHSDEILLYEGTEKNARPYAFPRIQNLNFSSVQCFDSLVSGIIPLKKFSIKHNGKEFITNKAITSEEAEDLNFVIYSIIEANEYTSSSQNSSDICKTTDNEDRIEDDEESIEINIPDLT